MCKIRSTRKPKKNAFQKRYKRLKRKVIIAKKTYVQYNVACKKQNATKFILKLIIEFDTAKVEIFNCVGLIQPLTLSRTRLFCRDQKKFQMYYIQYSFQNKLKLPNFPTFYYTSV